MDPLSLQLETTEGGSTDHVLDVLASHNHPAVLVGSSAQRWMGSAGMLTNGCDMLIRDSALSSIASYLVKTAHWEAHDPDAPPPWEICPPTERDADFVLRRIDIIHDSEYHSLSLWTETTCHISVDDRPTVEVPVVYPWQQILVEEQWHPAINRDDGWWYGPRLHPDSKLPNLPERAKPPTLFSKGLPRGKSATHDQPVSIPSLPTYLDALIYHITRYHQYSKPGL
jgi:hypothetical protein